MVAAVLHREKSAGVALDRRKNRRRRIVAPRRLANGRDIDSSRKTAPRDGAGFFPIADDMGDFRHFGEFLRLDLGRAAGDDDPRLGPLALETADRLAGLPGRFRRHGAGVDHDEAAFAALRRQIADGLRFGEIEPAAESDDFDFFAHDATIGAAIGAKISGVRRRENSTSTGPVMMM